MSARAPGAPAEVDALGAALARSAQRHARLCPRQVLGVRIGLEGLARCDLTAGDRRLVAVVETDGCFVDGVEAATGCSLGARTLSLEDAGKVAATFVDLRSGEAWRITPRRDVRARAVDFAPDATARYHAQLLGYQRMPSSLLLDVRPVRLRVSVEEILGRRGRVTCAACGEEVIDGREVSLDDRTHCRPCVEGAYYAYYAAI